jgi:hypothetical protein
MSDQTTQKQPYMISTYEPEEANGTVIFTFAPKGLQQVGGPGGTSKRVPQFVVAVRQEEGKLTFDWKETADDPGDAREEMEAEVAARMKNRGIWIERVTSLVAQVEQWAKEMGWSTRRVEKKLDDAWVGKHRVPALLMQQETCRALLEPIAYSTPSAEGVVDLYLMPAYDDIATLFYYEDRWNFHYNTSRGTNAVTPAPKEEAMPLSKESLERVLGEMRRYAE